MPKKKKAEMMFIIQFALSGVKGTEFHLIQKIEKKKKKTIATALTESLPLDYFFFSSNCSVLGSKSFYSLYTTTS